MKSFEEEERKKFKKLKLFVSVFFDSHPPFFSSLLVLKKQFKRTLLRAEETTARFIPRLFSRYHAETRENTSRRERRKKISKKLKTFLCVRVFFVSLPPFFLFFFSLCSLQKKHTTQRSTTKLLFANAILNARNTLHFRENTKARERERVSERRETRSGGGEQRDFFFSRFARLKEEEEEERSFFRERFLRDERI